MPLGVLATITCIAQGEGSAALELREVQVLDTAVSAQRVTVEGGQIVVRGTAAPTSPPATPPPPSPSATPVATISVPAATGPSGGVVLGLMLAALAVAILAVFILSRRPGG